MSRVSFPHPPTPSPTGEGVLKVNIRSLPSWSGKGQGWGGIALFLLLLFFVSIPTPLHAQPEQPLYAALGPESYAILRVLIGERRVVPIQAGGLADLLRQQTVVTLVLPEDWGDDTDLNAARAAGVAIFPVRRHNSVAAILANIQSLGDLTGTEDTAARWLHSIDSGMAQIQRQVEGYPLMRVLVLSPEGYTQGQGALITELIGLANGVNVAAEAGIPEARQIEDAQIRSLAPDVLLLINWSRESALIFAHNPLYRGLVAFEREHVYRTASIGKDPARLVDDLQALADWLHPAVF